MLTPLTPPGFPQCSGSGSHSRDGLSLCLSDPLGCFHRSAQLSPSLSCWELRQWRAFCSDTSSYCKHFLLGSDYVYSFLSVCYVSMCVCMFECVCACVCVIRVWYMHMHALQSEANRGHQIRWSWAGGCDALSFLFLFLVLLGVILGLLFFKFSVFIIWKFHPHI